MTDKEIQKSVTRLKAYAECFRKKTGRTPIEECNKDLWCDGCTLLYAQGTTGQHLKDIETAIAILENKPQWIPTDERLPETVGYYIVTDDAGGMKTVEISFFVPECESPWDYVNVTAWMPLPPSYQGEENG